MNIKYFLKIGLTLLIISAVTASLLAFVNYLTKDRIAENELAVMQGAIESIFSDSDSIKELKGEYEAPIVAVYEVYKGEQLLGYGVQTEPVGFKDKIGLIVGVDNDRKCVGVEVTTLSDTPGVGTKVKEKSFLEGFIGFDRVSIDEADTIAGSTISSAAVKKGVKAALAFDAKDEDEEILEENEDIFYDDMIPDDELPEEYIPEEEIPDDELPGDLFDEPIEAPENTSENTDQNGDTPVSSDGGVA